MRRSTALDADAAEEYAVSIPAALLGWLPRFLHFLRVWRAFRKPRINSIHVAVCYCFAGMLRDGDGDRLSAFGVAGSNDTIFPNQREREV